MPKEFLIEVVAELCSMINATIVQHLFTGPMANPAKINEKTIDPQIAAIKEFFRSGNGSNSRLRFSCNQKWLTTIGV